MNIRIIEQDHSLMRRTLRSSFATDDGAETGCILIVGENRHTVRPAILVREVLTPEAGDIAQASRGHLQFSAGFLRRAMLRVRELGLAGFLTVHTHPMSSDRVSFSPYDNAEDPQLMKNLYDQQPGGIFGSVVAGSEALQGRLCDGRTRKWKQLDTLVVIGDNLTFLPMTGERARPAPAASEIFDRSLALTGQGALATLSKMRIGVVGASGTGALAIEALARAGVGEIVIFEFDVADVTNLGRVLHMRRSDAETARPKADRLKEVIEEMDLGTRVTIIKGGDIRDAEVAAELAGLDVIFGSVDNSHWARLVMSEVCHQYLIPYVDVGTEIGLSRTKIQSLDTRLSYSAADRPCLVCSGIIDLEQVRIEGLVGDERERVLAMGYTKDTRLSAPAVMDLNMIAVGQGILLLRHLLQPFLETPIPAHIRAALTVYSMRGTDANRNEACTICGPNGRKAFGDARPLTVQRNAKGATNSQ